MSQNNVAKEAGKDPTALKKSRFPELVREIQEWVANNSTISANRIPSSHAEAKIAELQDTIASLRAQRDRFASELLSAKHKIFQQWERIQQLETGEQSNVVDLKGRRRK